MRFHHRAVPIALAAVLIDAIGYGIVGPVLPSLIVELSQVSMADATRIGGYMLISFAVAQFFAGPILGSLGDRFGRRPVLLASMIAFSMDYVLMAFAPSLAWLFVGRVIAGISGAIFAPAASVLTDVTPPEKRGATFGLIGSAIGAGLVIGPAIGGLLAEFGHTAPFLAAAGFAMLNTMAIAILLPETHKPENRRAFEWRRANAFGAFKPLFRMGGLTPVLVALLLWNTTRLVYVSTWAYWGRLAFGWDAQAVGWSLTASGVGMALAPAIFTGRFIRRFGERRTAMIALAVAALGFAAYASIQQGWQLYPVILISMFGGLVQPTLVAILSNRVDAMNQGALQGGVTSLNSMSQIMGPLVMTQTLAFGAEHGFPGAAMALAAVLSVVGLAIVRFGVGRNVSSLPAVVG